MTNYLNKILSWLLCLTMIVTSVCAIHVNSMAAGLTPESGNIYYIKNKNSGMYLMVENDSDSNGSKSNTI